MSENELFQKSNDFVVASDESALNKRAKQLNEEPEIVIGHVNSGAHQLAALLTDADLRGHYSHGVNRLDIYLKEIGVGVGLGNGSKNGSPNLLSERGATAWVDGANCLGAVVGNFCTQLAIEKAKQFGIALIVAKNSNHFGICAHYSTKIAEHGLIGMSFTNASPILFPTGSAEKSLGSNPICMVANGTKDQFALDMATSNVAYGKVEVASQKGHAQIPKHWGADSMGGASILPATVMGGGGLLPLGSFSGYDKDDIEAGPSESPNNENVSLGKYKVAPKDASHKGFGLAMMVEMLCGILSGSHFGKTIRRWRDVGTKADLVGLNLGQCFIAIQPDFFAPNFGDRLQNFIDETHDLKPADADTPVLIPGEPEKIHINLCKSAGGIIYDYPTIKKLNAIANQYNVEPLIYKNHLIVR